ncbi:MAG: DUF1254 domain-containing protein [Gammaproteobacteria bacterium]
MNRWTYVLGACLTFASSLPALALAEDVNIQNFVRAETDHMIRVNMKMLGLTVGKPNHIRQPTTPDKQAVIRSNQDTLYSCLLLDLSKPATLTLPEIGGRYMSAHVINQDHYMFVETRPGDYPLTRMQ